QFAQNVRIEIRHRRSPLEAQARLTALELDVSRSARRHTIRDLEDGLALRLLTEGRAASPRPRLRTRAPCHLAYGSMRSRPSLWLLPRFWRSAPGRFRSQATDYATGQSVVEVGSASLGPKTWHGRGYCKA